MKGRLPKKWGFDSLQIYGGRGGGLARKRGGVFEGELLPQCTLWSTVSRRTKLKFLGYLCKICS